MMTRSIDEAARDDVSDCHDASGFGTAWTMSRGRSSHLERKDHVGGQHLDLPIHQVPIA